MAADAPSLPAASVLVVGSFPPVTGPSTAATLAAVRRAWAGGAEVVTAGLRASGADLVAPVAGVGAGWRLERARVAAGAPAHLVLSLEPGQLGVPGRVGRAAASIAGLVPALARFQRVTVLLSGPLDLPVPLLGWLWRQVDAVEVQAGDRALARAAGVPPALVGCVDAYPAEPAVPGVTALGPPEVRPADRVTVLAGRLGRRVLGERFLPLRARALRVAGQVRRRVPGGA